ncbi:DUF2975 domain-containing protein [Metasolibacillus meyeri]|uniref:DUF2975 domain-containing protein n=1 Tax=Metasolibacillus meyeri TaxID=1071052 RepID=A0AAW9NXH4_9BACL|nr:DUF2975 domain-containing protein [Metasolibacillus meyeri]MEC1180839.1 DUF2975 domain-containing protein [Metasolibacillus meyeri]
MELILQRKKFQTFISVFHILMKIVLAVSSVVLGGLLLLLAFIGIMPSEKMVVLLEKGEIQATLNIGGVKLVLSDQVLNSFQFDKALIIALLLLCIFYIVLLLWITYCVQSILKGLKINQVFTMKNSKYIEWIAYGFILMSLTIKFTQTMTIYLFDQIFSLSYFMEKSQWIKAISYDFFSIHWSLLFGGVVIWIISRIFKYGVFLQEEFDTTL